MAGGGPGPGQRAGLGSGHPRPQPSSPRAARSLARPPDTPHGWAAAHGLGEAPGDHRWLVCIWGGSPGISPPNSTETSTRRGGQGPAHLPTLELKTTVSERKKEGQAKPSRKRARSDRPGHLHGKAAPRRPAPRRIHAEVVSARGWRHFLQIPTVLRPPGCQAQPRPRSHVTAAGSRPCASPTGRERRRPRVSPAGQNLLGRAAAWLPRPVAGFSATRDLAARHWAASGLRSGFRVGKLL